MADDTKAASDSGDQFKNFPEVPEGHTRVYLNSAWAPQREQLKGPGWAHVPNSWLAILEKQPELVRVDATGTPLPTSTAASAGGFTGTVNAGSTIPAPERDEDGEETNADEPVTALDAHRTAVADAAESGERTGGESIGETGSHLDESRTFSPRLGFAADASSTSSTKKSDAKPATKTALREYGDLESLKSLGAKNNVKGAADWTSKEEATDALYDARVTID